MTLSNDWVAPFEESAHLSRLTVESCARPPIGMAARGMARGAPRARSCRREEHRADCDHVIMPIRFAFTPRRGLQNALDPSVVSRVQRGAMRRSGDCRDDWDVSADM